MSDSDPERTVHWYYQAHGKEMGPVFIARLRQMARQGLLKPGDLVKKGATGDWVYAARVAELLSHAEEYAVPSPLLPDVLAEENEPQELLPRGPSLAERVSDLATGILSALSERWEWWRNLAGVAALSVTLFFLAQVVLPVLHIEWSHSPDPLVTYQILWDELQKHRQARANDAIWQEFSARAQHELEPILARLERQAGSSNREAQLLLWAGRDCLLKMFQDARTSPSHSEKQLAEYLHNVTLLREGKPIYGGNAGGRHSPKPSLKSWMADEPAMAAFTLLLTTANLILVALLARGLLKRRSSSPSS